MAAAIAARQELIRLTGGRVMLLASITLDTAYPTGGTPNITALLGLASIDALLPITKLGLDVEYLRASDKLRVYNGTGGALNGPHSEIANNANLSTSTIDVLVIGKT